MKKKLLFFMVAALALSCLFVTASASTINDVIFTKGDTEVYRLEAGEIGATLDVTVTADTTAALITAAYEDNRLTNIRYQGAVALSTSQSTYEALPVLVTADTTRVDVMLWGADNLAPIDTKESLTSVSRQIRITDVSVAEADDETPITFTGYVDNETRKIYVEQIVDYMGPKKAADGGKDSSYYNERVEGDYKALSNTFSYKLNGEAKTATLTLDTATPQKLTVAAPSGREKTYDVILEKHVAFTTYNFNADSSFVETTDARYNATTTTKTALKLNALDFVMYNGRSRWKNENFYVVNYNTNSITTYQDTTADAYYKVSRVTEEADKTGSDGVYKAVVKRADSDGLYPHIQIQDYGNDVHSLLRQDKYDYSFDFRFSEYEGKDALFAGGIAGDWGVSNYVARILIAKSDNAAEGALGLSYKPSTGVAVKIADILPNEWYNIRIVADNDAADGKIKIVLNGEIIYKTDTTTTAGFTTTSGAGTNTFRGYSASTANGTFYLDNIIRTYSQAKPAA